MSQAEIDVLAERQRQIHSEGWDEAHDEQWTDGELAAAAACYCIDEERLGYEPEGWGCTIREWLWPFDAEWWKPKDRRRDLIRAAALIIAEIDRIDREKIDAPRDSGKEGA